jgi:hypothetical protein
LDIKKPGPWANGQLLGSRVDIDRVHETQVNDNPSAGRYGPAVSPSAGPPGSQWNLMLTGKSKQIQEMVLCGGLKNEIGKTLQHQVTDQRRKIHVEVRAVIFELIRFVDFLQAGMALQKCFERFHPG